MPRLIDLTGQVFGRLTVIERGHRHHKHTFWKCRCSCGTEKDILSDSLRAALSTSCGCFHREDLAARSTTHGGTYSAEYHCWAGMLVRCRNPKSTEYHNYGGRGITVSPSWNDFARFLADVGKRPSPLHSLERVNNDGGYFPGNVVWATRKTQSRNRRGLRMIVYKGRRQCLKQWTEELGLPYDQTKGRLRSGWTVEKAFSEAAAAKPSRSRS
jgi:hypothetical protein